MSLDSEIIIVSGLPRSGTSLMMQMLHEGGIEVVTDHVRTADVDNPRGYFEFETAKKIEKDVSWLPGTRGKTFKMVSQLLYHLPSEEKYRIVFMRRDLDEVLASQEKMLKRRSAPAAPRESMKQAFISHLEKLFDWLDQQPNMKVLQVNYNELLTDPEPNAQRVSEFLSGAADADVMISVVDPELYRNRSAAAQT